MRIAIAGDHHGYIKKAKIIEYLKSLGHEVINYGTDTSASVDYPLYAFKVGEAINNKEVDLGILLCGTGIGMSIAANKVKGVRCALVHNTKDAKFACIHNNANCLALSSDFSMLKIKDILDSFFRNQFTDTDRHKRRIEMIDNYDN